MRVDLTAGFNFIDTGNAGNHTSFAFNLLSPSLATVSLLSSPWGLNANNPSNNSPFGNYTTGLDCCTNTGAPGVPSPLLFRVTGTNGITVLGPAGNQFTSNTNGVYAGYNGGWWFSADVVGPDGATTGLVAARDITLAIPEPETYAMMLAGIGLMGFVARRRKQTNFYR